jgi:hypothetical protein
VRRGSISHRVNPLHLEALISADHNFLFKYDTELDHVTRELFKRREIGLTEMMVSERILEGMKSGHMLDAFKLLTESPKASKRVLRQIGEGLGKRLKARF